MLALLVFQSCLSALAVSFLFREQRRPSRPPVFFLPGICEKKQRAEDLSGRWQVSSHRLNARVPCHHRREREHSPVLFTQHNQRPSAVSDMISFGASDGEIDDRIFFWQLQTWRSYRALWMTPPSYHRPLHVTPDSERMRISSASWQRLSMSSNGLCCETISQQAGRVSTPWIQRLRDPPDQPGRKRRGPSLATTGPPSKQLLMCLWPPHLMLGAEQSVFLVTAAINDKIKHIHFQKESKIFFCLP